jgi:hypothetical protein
VLSNAHLCTVVVCAAYKFANKAHTLHHWLDVMDGGTMWDVGGNPDDHDVIITSIGASSFTLCLTYMTSTWRPFTARQLTSPLLC